MTNCCDDYGNCNQGRECPVRNYRTWSKSAAPVVDQDRERVSQEAWLALVRRTGAGAGVHTGEDSSTGDAQPDWVLLSIVVGGVLAFVAAMAMLYQGLPVLVSALPVVVAVGLELIREIAS